MTFNRHINGDHLGACNAVNEKIAIERAAQTAIRTATTAVDPHKLSSLYEAANTNLHLASSLAGRLLNAMDFICGPEPESKAQPEGYEVGGAALDMLNENQRRVWIALDNIDTQLRRLERVVG